MSKCLWNETMKKPRSEWTTVLVNDGGEVKALCWILGPGARSKKKTWNWTCTGKIKKRGSERTLLLAKEKVCGILEKRTSNA
jgi:hypothetical protein